MLNKEEAISNIEGILNKFWSSLAFSAPENYEYHWNNFKDSLRFEIEQIYEEDDNG